MEPASTAYGASFHRITNSPPPKRPMDSGPLEQAVRTSRAAFVCALKIAAALSCHLSAVSCRLSDISDQRSATFHRCHAEPRRVSRQGRRTPIAVNPHRPSFVVLAVVEQRRAEF